MFNAFSTLRISWLASVGIAGILAAAAHATERDSSADELAAKIAGDAELREVLEKAHALIKTGLTAGSGYGEVWIRDLNTFIELAVRATPAEPRYCFEPRGWLSSDHHS